MSTSLILILAWAALALLALVVGSRLYVYVMVRPVVVSLSALSSLTSKSICEFCPQECPDTQVHLLGKLPNDGNADPLAAIYDVDLAIPADKVVGIFLIISKIEKMALRWTIMVFFAGRTVAHGNRRG